MQFRTLVFALALVAVPSVSVAQSPMLPPQPKVHPAGIPSGAVMLSPCVATMGFHWASLKDMPFGPIYGVMNGKPVFTEVMIDQKLFAAGKSWDELLKPLPGYRINHVDIDFEPHGHPGYPIPHYDVHGYYVSHATHMAFCPNGMRVVK